MLGGFSEQDRLDRRLREQRHGKGTLADRSGFAGGLSLAALPRRLVMMVSRSLGHLRHHRAIGWTGIAGARRRIHGRSADHQDDRGEQTEKDADALHAVLGWRAGGCCARSSPRSGFTVRSWRKVFTAIRPKMRPQGSEERRTPSR